MTCKVSVVPFRHSCHSHNILSFIYLYLLITVIHAYAKSGGVGAAKKAQELLNRMQVMYQQGNELAKPDTITVSKLIINMTRFRKPPSPALSVSLVTNQFFFNLLVQRRNQFLSQKWREGRSERS